MPLYDTFEEQIHEVLTLLEENQSFRTIDRADDTEDFDFDLTTNDYFGLSDYDEEELIDIIKSDGDPDLTGPLKLYTRRSVNQGGSTGSRLVSGNNDNVRSLEQLLAARMNASQGVDRECLIFNSGYHANVGIIPALAKLNKKTLIVMDQLIHASIIDGVRLAHCNFKRFKHNDLEHLDAILSEAVNNYENIIICIESIYSMDGDGIEDLKELAILKSKYSEQANIILYCDEAHACGLFGEAGFGRAEDEDCVKAFDIIVCPLGKAFNSFGCLLFTKPLLKQYIVNSCRSFIYSTALPPNLIEYSRLSYLALNTNYFKDEAEELLDNTENLKEIMQDAIISLGYDQKVAQALVIGDYQILGFILGSNTAVLEAKKFFADQSIKVSAIRYPTVPKGQERLRISLTSLLSQTDFNELAEVFTDFINSEVCQDAIEDYVDREMPEFALSDE